MLARAATKRAGSPEPAAARAMCASLNARRWSPTCANHSSTTRAHPVRPAARRAELSALAGRRGAAGAAQGRGYGENDRRRGRPRGRCG